MKKIAEKKVVIVKPARLEFKLKEIPSGVSFSHEKKLRQQKILETPKCEMNTKSNSPGVMSQLAFVTFLEEYFQIKTFSYKIFLPDGRFKTGWNKTSEKLRSEIYNFKLKKGVKKVSNLKVLVAPHVDNRKEMRFA